MARMSVCHTWTWRRKAHRNGHTVLLLHGNNFGGFYFKAIIDGLIKAFQERMHYIAKTVPNGNGDVLLIPGLGHVPHLEAPEKVLPPLVAFLKQGLSAK